MDVEEIRVKIKKLPDHLIPEVLDYIEFLLNKYGNKETVESKNKFKFDWEGGLSKLKDQYTSVELQHKAMDWR
jgi:hypothetical protein